MLDYHHIFIFVNTQLWDILKKRIDFKWLCFFVVSIEKINQWKRRDEVDYIYLASTTGLGISISITYILFLTKMQKRQTPAKGFALFENDITTN